MGCQAPVFQSLNVLSAEASLYPSMSVSGVTCWEVSLASGVPSPEPPSLSQALFRSHSPMAGGPMTPTPSCRAAPAGALKGQQGPGAHSPPCFEANPPAHCSWRHPTWPARGTEIHSLYAQCLLHPQPYLRTLCLFRAGDEWGAIYRKSDSILGAERKATIDTSLWQSRFYPSAFGRALLNAL